MAFNPGVWNSISDFDDIITLKPAAYIHHLSINDEDDLIRAAIAAVINTAAITHETRCTYASKIPEGILTELADNGYTVVKREDAANPDYLYTIAW